MLCYNFQEYFNDHLKDDSKQRYWNGYCDNKGLCEHIVPNDMDFMEQFKQDIRYTLSMFELGLLKNYRVSDKWVKQLDNGEYVSSYDIETLIDIDSLAVWLEQKQEEDEYGDLYIELVDYILDFNIDTDWLRDCKNGLFEELKKHNLFTEDWGDINVELIRKFKSS